MVADTFTRPDDDWVPVLMFRDGGGALRTALVQIPEDLDERAATAETITATLREVKATEAVLVTSMWIYTVTPSPILRPEDLVRPSQHPDRREVVALSHVTRDRTRMEMAPILRYPDRPPRLGDFDKASEGLSVVVRFVDAMRKGIG